MDEFLHRDCFTDLRDGALERLFRRAYEDFLQPGCFQDLSFGMLSDDRTQDIDSDFAGFFGEPFKSVRIFGRTYGHSEIVWVGTEIRYDFLNPGFCIFRVVRDYPASEHIAFPVNHAYFISETMPQNFDAVYAFVLAETADATLDII